jgi:3-dehydroquinate synthase
MNNWELYSFGPYTTELRYEQRLAPRLFFPPRGGRQRRQLFVFDETTIRLFGPAIFGPAGLPEGAVTAVLPRGEEAKCWESVSTILRAAVENGFGRDALFAGVGGGIICDLTAFAASVFMRGCGLLLFPTTLLAMVDASLGGKTGINFSGYKNMAGTFYPAEQVLVVPEVLSELPRNELLSGIAETIKHACLGEETLFSILEKQREAVLKKDAEVLSEIIQRSIAVKAGIVEQDLTEAGIRAHLNLGHTFGHALESLLDLRGSGHGEAVAWGLSMAVRAGLRLGITDAVYGERVMSLLEKYGYRLRRPVDPDRFLQALKQDKKKREGRVRFVLQKDLGETVLREVDETIIRRIIADQTP